VRLQPPLAPLRPGSYDFGRDMYFSGIGASGFAMGAIKTADPPQDGGLRLRYAATMQGLRDAIDARIDAWHRDIQPRRSRQNLDGAFWIPA
jgi:competence protein ComEC